MANSFNCGSCSAPLEFEGTPTQKCRYCSGTVIAPPELFYATSRTPFGDFSSLTGKALKIAEINQLVHDGKKIEAIKLFRETFGVGLEQAKDAVERMERGESVDISGMRVQSSRVASPADIETVKKIGYTIGGSILATILASLLIVAGIVGAILYFTWSAMERLPTVANASTTSQTSPSPETPVTQDSTELLQIGGDGKGEGLFKDNRHVAVDGFGRIYSSNYSPHRIQVFGGDGKFQNWWAPETGSNLYDLVADREGNIYLANDKGIFKHDGASGEVIAKTTNIYPRGIAMTWDGKILVAAGKAISVLDSSLKTAAEFKDAAANADATFGFEKITSDGEGNIYALDSHNDEICKFSSEGKFLNRFESGANAPHALAVDPKGRLFVSDTNKIFVLDGNGRALRSIDTHQAFGMAFDKEGNLYIAARPYVLKRRLNF